MTEIAKGVLGGAAERVEGWVLPSAIFVALLGLLVLPDLAHLPIVALLVDATPEQQTVVLLIAAVVLGLGLSALRTPLYRVLEGYLLWPRGLKEKGKARQRRRRDDAARSLPVSGPLGVDGALALERYLRFPAADDQVAPTRLGNGIRRFEHYGEDRYQLDLTLLWFHLRAVVPESLSKSVDRAAAGVDFFVCTIYLSVGLALAAAGAWLAVEDHPVRLAVTAGAAVLVVPAAYRAAVAATDGWSAAVRAVVDAGRVPLAAALGLRLPATLEQERTMWRAVGWLLMYDYRSEAAAAIDPFRLAPAAAGGATQPDGEGNAAGAP